MKYRRSLKLLFGLIMVEPCSLGDGLLNFADYDYGVKCILQFL